MSKGGKSKQGSKPKRKIQDTQLGGGNKKAGDPKKHVKRTSGSSAIPPSTGGDAGIADHGMYTVSDEKDLLNAPADVVVETKEDTAALQAARRAVTSDVDMSQAHAALKRSSKDAVDVNAIAGVACKNAQEQYALVPNHISKLDIANFVFTPETWMKTKKDGTKVQQDSFKLGDASAKQSWMANAPRVNFRLAIGAEGWTHGLPTGDYKGVTRLPYGSKTFESASQTYSVHMWPKVWEAHYANRMDEFAPKLSDDEQKEIMALSQNDPHMTKCMEKLKAIDKAIWDYVWNDKTLGGHLRAKCEEEIRDADDDIPADQSILPQELEKYARRNKWNNPISYEKEDDPKRPGKKVTNRNHPIIKMKKPLLRKRYENKKRGVEPSNIHDVMSDFGIAQYGLLEKMCEPSQDAKHGMHFSTINIKSADLSTDFKHNEGPRRGDMVSWTVQVSPYFHQETCLAGWHLVPVSVAIISRGPPFTGGYDPEAGVRDALAGIKVAGSQTAADQRALLASVDNAKQALIKGATDASKALIVRQDVGGLLECVSAASKASHIAAGAILFGSEAAYAAVNSSLT